MRVLILGGTGEARELAATLAREGIHSIVSSLAGRVSNPALPAGEVRIGGFGGATGLAAYLRAEGVDVLIDATHPFAAAISKHAAAAAAETGHPLVLLRRPGWIEGSGDSWLRRPDITTAAATVAAGDDGCIFVTTGRRDLAAFSADDRHQYLVRTVDPPTGATPPRITLMLDRGPYTVAGEAQLMQAHRVNVLVTKDSGGELTVAKLIAARELGIPVVMVDRPPLPDGVRVVNSVAEVRVWLDGGYDGSG